MDYESIGKAMFQEVISAQQNHPLGIQYAVNDYTASRDAMFEIVLSQGKITEKNIRQMRNINETLSRVYHVSSQINKILLDYEKLYINTWGPIFWKYLHSVSILIQQAYYTSAITDLLLFNDFVKNIEQILPCPICKSHYASVKFTKEFEDIFKLMDFGFLVSGVYRFHNAITKNIATTTHGVYKEFNTFHFTFQYGCYPRSKATNFIETGVVKTPVKFYRPEYVKISIITMMAFNINYFHASNLVSIICERLINLQQLTTPFGTSAGKIDVTTYTRDQVDVLNNTTEMNMMRETPVTVFEMLGYCKRHLKPNRLNMLFDNPKIFKINSDLWHAALNLDNKTEYKIVLNNGQSVTF